MRTTDTITQKQIATLTLIYRFRFVTARHVQQALGQKHNQDGQRVLDLLLAKELIGRRYTGQDKLNGRPAAYFLLPGGMRILKQHKPGVNAAALKAAYKDKTISPTFISRCLTIGDVNAAIISHYGQATEFYTKTELKSYDFLPEKQPDAYVTIPAKLLANQFLIEVCDDSTPPWVQRRYLQRYVEYAETDEWESATNTPMPTIILICESPAKQSRLLRQANQELEDSYVENLKFRVTTPEQISASGF